MELWQREDAPGAAPAAEPSGAWSEWARIPTDRQNRDDSVLA